MTNSKKVNPKDLKSREALLDRFDEMIDEVVEGKTTIILYDDGGSPVAAIVPYEAVEILEEVTKHGHGQHEDRDLGLPARTSEGDKEIIGKLPLNIIQQLVGNKKK